VQEVFQIVETFAALCRRLSRRLNFLLQCAGDFPNVFCFGLSFVFFVLSGVRGREVHGLVKTFRVSKNPEGLVNYSLKNSIASQ